MAFSEFELKRYEKIVGEFIEKCRPAPHLRNQVDLSFRIEKQSIVIFEKKERWNKPGEKYESAIAKATYVKTKDKWKIYWQLADLKWHSYEPTPEVNTIEEFIAVVQKDEFGCFWG